MRKNCKFTVTHTGKTVDTLTFTYDKMNTLSNLEIKVNFLNLTVHLPKSPRN